MSDIINLRKNAASLEISPEFDAYGSVEVILAKEGNTNKVVTVGEPVGRKLTIEMTQCSDTEQARAAAERILNQLRGFQYQPYTAEDALLDPAAEIGDAVNINGTYSGIYNKEINFTPLLRTKLVAPQDEAINHEYSIRASTNKTLTREMGQAYAQMSINAQAIRAEVSRANEAEGELLSAIEQTAEKIAAKVDSSSTGSSFGWELTADSWVVYGNGRPVFSVTESGAEVVGTIRATDGTIGGFTIGSRALYNNISDMSSSLTQGVYLGTDGIKLGSNFKVDSLGNITANNATLSGTLMVGGSSITASNLRSGATHGNRVGGGMSGNGTSGSHFKCEWLDVENNLQCGGLSVSGSNSSITMSGRYAQVSLSGSSSSMDAHEIDGDYGYFTNLNGSTVRYGSNYSNRLTGKATVTIDGKSYTFATAD